MTKPNLTDEQLVSVIRESDKELYGEIIRRYQEKLSHYLRKFIRNPDELEDVLQEVFIKAYKNLYGFNIDKKFSPWIYRIAHNEAINSIKKLSNQHLSLDEQEWEIVDKKMDILEKVSSKMEREAVEKQLFVLKNKYREPLILYFFEQKTYEEISDILHMPVNTIGTLISRGKKRLRDKLDKKYDIRK